MCVPCHHGMTRPHDVDREDGLWLWKLRWTCSQWIASKVGLPAWKFCQAVTLKSFVLRSIRKELEFGWIQNIRT